MQAGETRDFVRQAKSRPIPEDRQRQFAVARVQAQMKIHVDQARKLVDEVWNLPDEELNARKGVQHGTDRPSQDTQAPAGDTADTDSVIAGLSQDLEAAEVKHEELSSAVVAMRAELTASYDTQDTLQARITELEAEIDAYRAAPAPPAPSEVGPDPATPATT